MTPATPTADHLIAALRASHERLSALVKDLDAVALESPSYDSEWSIGQVLSHLGSQAVIFELLLEASLSGAGAPGSEVFQPVWDEWNAKSPLAVRDDSLAANEKHVAMFESMAPEAAETFHISLFGLELDLAGLVRMRLSEHAVHTWDVAVALDPSATVEPDAVDLLLPGLDATVSRVGKAGTEPFRVRVGTSHPTLDLVVTVGDGVSLDAAEPDDTYDGAVDLPAEAFLRLVYGRLDPDHTPVHDESGARGLADLRAVLPGL